MKNKNPNAAQIWKQLEDHLVPRLRLSITDRAVYSHLLRHSRLEGRTRLRFSISWLARGARLSDGLVREAVRRLVAKGALSLVERSRVGHVVEFRLPDEIRACSPRRAARPGSISANDSAPPSRAVSIEEIDFLKTKKLRQVIHSRERGFCFYCLRRLTSRVRCLDHVLPRVRAGRNSYRNLVSSRVECNSQKGARPAADFLRSLYRERRLTAVELTARRRALDALASGKFPLLFKRRRRVVGRKSLVQCTQDKRLTDVT
jgi:5-methylcytosine-specific restriction endonuclease McrA